MNSIKKIIVLAGIMGFVFMAMAAQTLVQDLPKNLKVLPKNISEKKLDSVMGHFEMALGVKCDFCHTLDKKTNSIDFARDDKPEKEITRKMMLMTNAINKNYFTYNGKYDPNAIQAVSCATCHRGNPRPVTDSSGLSKPQ
jgi:hypothetical protein